MAVKAGQEQCRHSRRRHRTRQVSSVKDLALPHSVPARVRSQQPCTFAVWGWFRRASLQQVGEAP
eukprot:scaffold300683_cov36-Tisochrysis_lutea.AAC.1